MDTIVIWNAESGGAEAAEPARDVLLRRQGTEVWDVRTRLETIEAGQRAADAGAGLLVAAGGDGTVNAVVNGIMASGGSGLPPAGSPADGCALAVLPIGTANDFARTLDVPLDPLQTVESLNGARTRRVDVVRSVSEGQSHYFINMATAGNSERVIEHLTAEQKDWWGPLCYIRGAIDVAFDLESYDVTLRLDDGPPRTYTAWNVILANGRTSAAGLPIAPLANLEDGLLDVIIVTDGTLPDLMEIGARLWLDKFLDSELVELHRAQRVEISSTPPLRFTADGDLIEWVPASFEVQPGALNVVVGPEYAAVPEPAAQRQAT